MGAGGVGADGVGAGGAICAEGVAGGNVGACPGSGSVGLCGTLITILPISANTSSRVTFCVPLNPLKKVVNWPYTSGLLNDLPPRITFSRPIIESIVNGSPSTPTGVAAAGDSGAGAGAGGAGGAVGEAGGCVGCCACSSNRNPRCSFTSKASFASFIARLSFVFIVAKYSFLKGYCKR